jgi:UDP-N-acetylglucosamine diphosphorylase / glucose-1-phosphate thymidylyltransferase / UDP-N-acetylgalactosamine diphosphorylase / glucosamine-1-phosphate N-acetyltransferase / galactosamine-1-phosphate N-acetyltransferase
LKAVVLAAGEGVRLQPVTATRPKHLIRVGGKPILQHCLETLKRVGITEVVLVTHYMASGIREFFGDGEKLHLKIEYVKQPSVLGTGNAAAVAEPHLKGGFLLVYGDLLYSPECVKRVMDNFDEKKVAAAMAVVPVEKPENYGIVALDKKSKVIRVVEKPARKDAPSKLANAGIYAFTPTVFEVLRRIQPSIRGELELTDAISLFAKNKKPVLAVELPKTEWLDIGHPWDLLEANAWVLNRMEHKVRGKVEDGAHLIGPVTVAETARIRSGAYIEGPSLVDEASDIGPNCFIRPCTSIGKNVRVGNAVEIKNSIIMDGTHVGHLSYIGDSILCERCNLGAGTITANYRLDAGSVKMEIKGKRVDSGRRKLGAVLGDEVKTGISTLLMPGVKVGIKTWVGPNYMVQSDLPANTIVFAKQNSETKRSILKKTN